MSNDALLMLVVLLVLETISAVHIATLRRQRDAWKATAERKEHHLQRMWIQFLEMARLATRASAPFVVREPDKANAPHVPG